MEIIIVGVDPSLKGGIANVITQYHQLFKNAGFFFTRRRESTLIDFLFFPIYCMQFINLLLINPVQIVHIHGASRGSFYRKYLIFLIAKYLFKRKVIYHIHGAEFHLFYNNSKRWVKRLVCHLIQKSDTVICLSNSWKKFVVDSFHAERVEIVSNFISVDPDYKKIRTNERLVFLFLGRIGNRKGIFDLLKVTERLNANFKDKFEVWIGGDGDNGALVNLVNNSELKETVRYFGWVEGKDKIKLLREADVYVLPSYNEGMPVSILEAMAHRLPIIATEVGGISEQVEHGRTGYLITPGDLGKLEEYMRKFIEEHELSMKLGAASFTRVQQMYSTTYGIAKLEEIYLSLTQ